MAEVSVDDELKIPIYFRSFDWPAEEGGQPRLLEEFFYRNVKLNVGLTDRDFDRQNPDYHFQKLEEVTATTLIRTRRTQTMTRGTRTTKRLSRRQPCQATANELHRETGFQPVIVG